MTKSEIKWLGIATLLWMAFSFMLAISFKSMDMNLYCSVYKGLKYWLYCDEQGELFKGFMGLNLWIVVPLWIIGLIGHVKKSAPYKSVLLHFIFIVLLFWFTIGVKFLY